MQAYLTTKNGNCTLGLKCRKCWFIVLAVKLVCNGIVGAEGVEGGSEDGVSWVAGLTTIGAPASRAIKQCASRWCTLTKVLLYCRAIDAAF